VTETRKYVTERPNGSIIGPGASASRGGVTGAFIFVRFLLLHLRPEAMPFQLR
jgi:hypothetical protein